MITTNAKIAWAKFMHNNAILSRQLNNGFTVKKAPTTCIEVSKGTTSMRYVLNKGILERCV